MDLTLTGDQNSAAFKWCRHSPVGLGEKKGIYCWKRISAAVNRSIYRVHPPSRGSECGLGFGNCTVLPWEALEWAPERGKPGIVMWIAHGFRSLHKAQQKYTFVFDIQFFKFYYIKTAKPH